MLATWSRRLVSLILFVCLQPGCSLFAQSANSSVNDWVKKLSSKNAPLWSGVTDVLPALANVDSSNAMEKFKEIENNGNSSNRYFTCRLNLAKAVYLREHNVPVKAVKGLMTKAITAAYETDNDSLISTISWQYGNMNYWGGEIELASMYSLNAAEIDEKIGRKIQPELYAFLGEVLYVTRDNEKSIYYTKKAIVGDLDTSFLARDRNMKRLNTIGLCWRRIGNYDSAFFYFNLALSKAAELKEEIWESIILGNKGQIYFAQKKYDLANPYLNLTTDLAKGMVNSAAPQILCSGWHESTFSKERKIAH